MKVRRELGRRKFVALCLEELEHRIAPALVMTGQPFSFEDGNGDAVTLTYSGPGWAEVLDAGAADPNTTDIATIQIFGSSASSKLVIKDTNPGLGNDDIVGGDITSAGPGANPFGRILFNPQMGVVQGTNITLTGELGSLDIRGAFIGGSLTIQQNLGNVTCRGPWLASPIDANQDMGVLRVDNVLVGDGNPATIDIDVNGAWAGLRVGQMLNVNINAENHLGYVQIRGGMTDSTMDINNGAGGITIGPMGMVDSTITATSGRLGAMLVRGSVSGSNVTLRSTSCPSIKIMGNLDEAVSGGSTVSVTDGALGRFYVAGNMDDSRLTLNDASRQLQSIVVMGNMIDNSAIDTSDVNIGRIYVGGNVSNTSRVGNGSDDTVAAVVIGGSVQDTARVNFDQLKSLTIRGDVRDDARITSDQTSRGIAIFGDVVGNPAGGITISCGAETDAVQIRGDASFVTFDFDSYTHRLAIGGAADNVRLDCDGAMDQVLFKGDLTNSDIDIDGGAGVFRVQGNADTNTIDIFGSTDLYFFAVDINNTTVNHTGSVGTLRVTGTMINADINIIGNVNLTNLHGNLTNDSDLNITGNGVRVFVSGSMGFGCSLQIGGTSDNISIGGDMTDDALIQVGGAVGGAAISGAMVGDSSLTVGGDLGRLIVSGGLNGNGPGTLLIDVAGNCGRTTFGSAATGMQGDSRFLVGGNLTALGIRGDVDGPGGGVSTITIGSPAFAPYVGPINVNGVVNGLIQVYGTVVNPIRTSGTTAQVGVPNPPFTAARDFTDSTGALTGGHLDANGITAVVS
ncbi:MAG: hypothetical protein GXP25_19115 [Planctomycetes bacterium]|nr:hypothetical protein [Planctomycetota bacterium]